MIKRCSLVRRRDRATMELPTFRTELRMISGPATNFRVTPRCGAPRLHSNGSGRRCDQHSRWSHYPVLSTDAFLYDRIRLGQRRAIADAIQKIRLQQQHGAYRNPTTRIGNCLPQNEIRRENSATNRATSPEGSISGAARLVSVKQ